MQDMEGAEHARHGTVDGHTIKKIISRTVAAGQLQYVSIAVPGSKYSQGTVDRQYLVAAGVPLDDRLLRKVSHHSRFVAFSCRRCCRSQAHDEGQCCAVKGTIIISYYISDLFTPIGQRARTGS